MSAPERGDTVKMEEFQIKQNVPNFELGWQVREVYQKLRRKLIQPQTPYCPTYLLMADFKNARLGFSH